MGTYKPGGHQQVGAHIHTVAAAATPPSLPAAAAGVVAVDKQAQLSIQTSVNKSD